MKFVAEVTTKYSGRLGTLFQSETGQKFQTPLLMQTTKGGSIPYLSKEVFNYVSNNDQQILLQISLSSIDHMEEALNLFKNGIGQYCGFKDSPVFVSLKDPNEIAPSGYNEKDIVPMFTRRGKQAITVERYMKLMETIKPDIYHTLCDSDTNEESAKKRIHKSVERTEIFLRDCIKKHKNSTTLSKSLLIAPIVGGYNKFSRSLSIKSALSYSEIAGYSIDGLHNYGETAMSLKIESLKDIVTHCIKELPVDKLKIMSGAFNPLQMLEMICLGVDVFDSSFAYIATQNFRALTFSFDSKTSDENSVYCINLNDKIYKDDFSPILKTCTCLCCKKHTKAYLHHLVKTKELLASILLMIHNIHHYMKFFETIRESILIDELPKLIDLVKNQMLDDINGKNSIVDMKKNDSLNVKSKRMEIEELN